VQLLFESDRLGPSGFIAEAGAAVARHPGRAGPGASPAIGRDRDRPGQRLSASRRLTLAEGSLPGVEVPPETLKPRSDRVVVNSAWDTRQ
jgi:hypothetical protein